MNTQQDSNTPKRPSAIYIIGLIIGFVAVNFFCFLPAAFALAFSPDAGKIGMAIMVAIFLGSLYFLIRAIKRNSRDDVLIAMGIPLVSVVVFFLLLGLRIIP
jgi:uncharacterized protein with PQ loop repeat